MDGREKIKYIFTSPQVLISFQFSLSLFFYFTFTLYGLRFEGFKLKTNHYDYFISLYGTQLSNLPKKNSTSSRDMKIGNNRFHPYDPLPWSFTLILFIPPPHLLFYFFTQSLQKSHFTQINNIILSQQLHSPISFPCPPVTHVKTKQALTPNPTLQRLF